MNLRIKKSTLGVALSALMLGAPGVVYADQADDVTALRQQILQMQQRLDELEASQKETKATAEKAAEASKKGVKSKVDLSVGGLLQVHAYAPLSGDGSQGNNTFRLRRGELKLTAKVNDRITGVAMFDIAKAKNAPKEKDAVLQEINIAYLLSKSDTNKTYIDVGQFKLPLGYESLTSSSALPLLDRSMIFTQGKYGDVRDTGAQLRGNAGDFEYRLGLFNGLGESQNKTASEDSKAFAGRVSWKAAEGFRVGASAAKAADSGKIFNLFAGYEAKKLWLSGEYGKGSRDSGATIVDGDGFNLTAGYRLSPKFEAVARYDKFDDTSKGSAKEMTLGLNYYIKSNNAKIQLNLVKHDGPSGISGKGFDHNWTELRSGFQVAF